MRRFRLWWVMVIIGLLSFTGCAGFDPARDEPCAFLDTKLQEDLGFVARPIDGGCRYVPRPGWDTGLNGIRIGYLAQAADQLATSEGLEPTANFGAMIDFKNRAVLPLPGRATCRLVGSIDQARSLVLEFDVDTEGIVSATVPPSSDPCQYLLEYDKRIASRLGA